jgi:predicted phage terminase large subunit-like protein
LPDDLFQIAIDKLNQFPVDKIGFEVTAAQSYMCLKFNEALYNNQIYTPVEGVISKGNKHERIISLEPEVKNGHILFNNGNIRYNNQVKDYNRGAKYDDAADSLYGAVQLVQGVQSLKFYDRGLLF